MRASFQLTTKVFTIACVQMICAWYESTKPVHSQGRQIPTEDRGLEEIEQHQQPRARGNLFDEVDTPPYQAGRLASGLQELRVAEVDLRHRLVAAHVRELAQIQEIKGLRLEVAAYPRPCRGMLGLPLARRQMTEVSKIVADVRCRKKGSMHRP